MFRNLMNLTKAQREAVQKLKEDHALPYEKRNWQTFKLYGRGMRRTLEALQKLGLVTFDEEFRLTGSFYVAHLTEAGKALAQAHPTCAFPTVPRDQQVWCNVCHKWTDKVAQ